MRSYTAPNEAKKPDIALPKKGVSGKSHIRHARIGNNKVAININHDVLEMEFARHRISQVAYCSGLLYTGISLEGMKSINPSFREKINITFYDNDSYICRSISNTILLKELRHEARSLIGQDREMLLYRILRNNEIPTFMEPTNRKRQFFISETFRNSLEILGENWFCA